jgi:hypothetical protein
MWRRVLQVLVMVLALAAGFWFGGALTRSLSVTAVAAVAGCVVLGDLVGGSERWQGRVASAVLAAVFFCCGWYLAGREIDAAYAECAQRGEEVRQALSLYEDMHGTYPASLSELHGVAIPGQRLLRPGLLEYERTKGGYELSFRDTVVRSTATATRPFFSRGE